jgi:sugar phosphate permease
MLISFGLTYMFFYNGRQNINLVLTQMSEGLGSTTAAMGVVSSALFWCYAFGQLINGLVGERIPAKWMICIGLLGAGVTNFVFSTVTLIPAAAMIAYGFTGLFLSMIYGPMTKVVAENTEPI